MNSPQGRAVWSRRLWIWPALVLAAGCSSPQPTFQPSGDVWVDGPKALASGPAQDRVLWQYRMASAAMRRAQFADARQQLDEALARVGSIFDADAASRRARGYFTAEARKTFLGEPYERVMAYY